LESKLTGRVSPNHEEQASKVTQTNSRCNFSIDLNLEDSKDGSPKALEEKVTHNERNQIDETSLDHDNEEA